jgi:hypothetical protein
VKEIRLGQAVMIPGTVMTRVCSRKIVLLENLANLTKNLVGFAKN